MSTKSTSGEPDGRPILLILIVDVQTHEIISRSVGIVCQKPCLMSTGIFKDIVRMVIDIFCSKDYNGVMDNQIQFTEIFALLLKKAYQNLYYAAHHQVEQQVYRPLYDKITTDSETQVNFLIDVEIIRQVGQQLGKRSANESI